MFAPTATDAGPVPAYTIDPHELTMKFLFCATPAHPHVQSNHAERRIEAQRGAYYVPKTVPLDSIMVEMLTIRHMLQHVPPFSPEAFVDMCHEYANAVAGTDHDAGIYPRSLKDAYSVFNGALNHMHKIAIRKLRAEVLAQPWAGKTAKDLSPYAPKKGEFWVHVDEEGDPLPEEEQEMRRNAARYEERVAREAASQSYEARLNASMEAKAARIAQACARADAEQARAEKARVETARRGAIERGVREARRASVRATPPNVAFARTPPCAARRRARPPPRAALASRMNGMNANSPNSARRRTRRPRRGALLMPRPRRRRRRRSRRPARRRNWPRCRRRRAPRSSPNGARSRSGARRRRRRRRRRCPTSCGPTTGARGRRRWKSTRTRTRISSPSKARCGAAATATGDGGG